MTDDSTRGVIDADGDRSPCGQATAVTLSPLREGRLIARMVELADLAGVTITRPPTRLPLDLDDCS